MALEEKSLPDDFVLDDELVSAIQANLRAGKLPCAVAFEIAAEEDVEPVVLGQTAALLRIHLSHCVLGLFGYPEMQKGWEAAGFSALEMPDELRAAIQAAVTENGTVACAKLWELAARFGVRKMQLGYLCDQLGIKVTPCQLGAF